MKVLARKAPRRWATIVLLLGPGGKMAPFRWGPVGELTPQETYEGGNGPTWVLIAELAG